MTSAQSDRDLTADEQRWLRRLQRTLDAQPDSLTIYCHGGNATALDTDAYRECDEHSLRDAILDDAASITAHNWIAGDF